MVGLSSDQVSVMSRPGQAVQLYTTAAAGIPEVGGTIDRLELARSAVGCHYFHLCLNLVLLFSGPIFGFLDIWLFVPQEEGTIDR